MSPWWRFEVCSGLCHPTIRIRHSDFPRSLGPSNPGTLCGPHSALDIRHSPLDGRLRGREFSIVSPELPQNPVRVTGFDAARRPPPRCQGASAPPRPGAGPDFSSASSSAYHIASSPASPPASRPASLQASCPASSEAYCSASRPASNPASSLAFLQASSPASPPASCPVASPASFQAYLEASSPAYPPASSPASPPASSSTSSPATLQAYPVAALPPAGPALMHLLCRFLRESGPPLRPR